MSGRKHDIQGMTSHISNRSKSPTPIPKLTSIPPESNERLHLPRARHRRPLQNRRLPQHRHLTSSTPAAELNPRTPSLAKQNKTKQGTKASAPHGSLPRFPDPRHTGTSLSPHPQTMTQKLYPHLLSPATHTLDNPKNPSST